MYNTQADSPPSLWSGLTRLIEGPIGWIITLILLPCLLIAALLLPPVNLLDRLNAFSATSIGLNGGTILEGDGTYINFPAESVVSSFSASLTSTPRVAFFEGTGGSELVAAADALPDHLTPKSPIYQATIRGTAPESAVITIPIPNDSLPYETLGLYMWTGESWEHVPNLVLPEADIIEARLNFVPDYFMVMQSVPDLPEVAAIMEFGSSLPENAVVTSEIVSGLVLRGDGAIEKEANKGAPPNTGNTFPIVRNWTGESWAPNIRTDLVNNMLIEIGQQDNQVRAVVDTVLVNNYPGVVLDYRAVDAVPSAMGDYVFLIKRIADELHAEGKTLTVRVETATQVSAEEWNTGGHDWRALGAIVDRVIIPAPVDPQAYAPNAEMDSLLRYATSEIDPRKIQIEFTGQSVEWIAPYALVKGYRQSFEPLANEINANASSGQVELSLENEQLAGRVSWNEDLSMYYYSYIDAQNRERTVYIESALSMARKLSQLAKYNVRKVALQTPPSNDIDPQIWPLLAQYQRNEDISAVAGNGRFDVLFSIYDESNNLVLEELRPIDNPTLAFPASEDLGDLNAKVTIISENGQPVIPALSSVLDASLFGGTSGRAVAAAVTDSGDDASVESEASDRSLAGAASDVATDVGGASTETVVAAADVPTGPIVSTGQLINVREGPGTVYNILGQITPGNSYTIVEKGPNSEWWKIEVAPGETGWVINSLVNASGELTNIAVATDIPEPPAIPVPAEVPEAAPEQAAPEQVAAAAVVSAPPPSGGIPFGYGVQAHMVHANNEGQVMNMTQGMGFNWVKQQIEWKVFEASQGNIDYGSADGIVNAANAAGINLLFSVVNAPAWAREPGFDGSVGGPPQDPNTFAAFNGAIAGKYCGSSVKAIEVWNEQNLHYEWGNKPLNANEYVALLAPSYAAIKAACPSMWVISGALTPAGNNGNLAMDDFTYLEQMFQAGVANYADGIGAHPSGYNVPPSKTFQEACEAIQISGNSFNGACDSPHHSWSFRSTMEGYRNIAVTYGAADKVIVPTEFGWAAGGAFDPRYAYADDNSYEEQAAWTVEAYQMMKGWGWVGPAILWNLNFRVVANGTEKAQWGIVDPGWSPLPAYNALRDMAK